MLLPIVWHERRVKKMAKAGKSKTHQAFRSALAEAIMAPHEACSPLIPNPRKERLDSAKIAPDIPKLRATIIEGSALGKRCLNRMRELLYPRPTALLIKGVFFTFKTSARKSLAMLVQAVSPMITIRLIIPPLITALKAITKSKPGKLSINSIKRFKMRSSGKLNFLPFGVRYFFKIKRPKKVSTAVSKRMKSIGITS